MKLKKTMKEHSEPSLESLIDLWLTEDIGEGDHTTLSTIPESASGKAKLLVKQQGILAGVSIAHKVFERFDPGLEFIELIADGSRVGPGEIAFVISGSVRSILQTERLVLNVMQRMSGIATRTHEYVKKLEGLKTKVLDTRKTSPGLRLLEKEAVRLGGGVNHRFGLYDMILIKDNHIDFAGGIKKALELTSGYMSNTGLQLKIVVEARSLNDVEIILSSHLANRILLDNFSPEMTRKAVELIGGACETESSGNITLDTIRDYALCGVDYISAGALTHQINSLDLSLKASF